MQHMAISTNPARGTRDFLPADIRKREYVIGIIKQVYESYGFEPLETPAFENIETLTGKYGEEGNQLIFRILKRGEKLNIGADGARTVDDLADLALRYDLTVPLARVVANNKNELPKFFKRYQIQPVWRADRPARGRFREFYQCDVDAIGSSSVVVEAELISAVAEILSRLGFDDFVIRVNHRDILDGILDVLGTPSERKAEVLVAIDKLDKVGVAGILKELADRHIHPDVGSGVVTLFGDLQSLENEAALEKIGKFVAGRLSADHGITTLKRIIELAEKVPIRVDASLARGLSYYTGTIMEINVPDLAGSLGGGGRYDELIGMFGKEQVPACGFSLGLERMIVVMDERGMFPSHVAESSSADVMVTIWSEETAGESIRLADNLRSSGLRVLVYPEADKLGKQFKYAGQVGVPYVCVLGESELAGNTVTLKNMQTGEQETVPRREISEKIR